MHITNYHTVTQYDFRIIKLIIFKHNTTVRIILSRLYIIIYVILRVKIFLISQIYIIPPKTKRVQREHNI